MARPRRRAETRTGRGGEAPLDVEIELAREVRRVSAALREQDRKLPTELRKQLRKTASSAVKRAKSEVRSMPVSGHAGSTGLRRRVARGVRVRASTRTGMRIVTAMPDSAESIIPRGLDSRTRHRGGGWRHPVFGNSDLWVGQSGGSWFLEPLQEERGPLIAGVRQVLDDAAQTVARAGG